MKIDLERAARLRRQVDAQPHECFRNSVLALACLPDQEIEKTFYIEGWLVYPANCMASEHGWLLAEDGIIDVTVLEEDPAVYVPVLTYTWQEVSRFVRNNARMPYFERRKAYQQKMVDAYLTLPLADFDVAYGLALLGHAKTGIEPFIVRALPR